MPQKPKRVCCSPNCHALTNDRYCVTHKSSQKKTTSKHSKLYSRRWRAVRAGFLRSHPICVECFKNDRMSVATEVDHIVPHDGDREKFWDIKNNLQPLCKPCHSRKTMKENQAKGKM